MSITLLPYLSFDGTSAEVLEFYHSVFGGEITKQTYGEAGMEQAEGLKDRIIHAELKCEAFSLMASDTHPQHSEPLKVGNNVNLSLIGDDQEKLTEYFQKLSDGARIIMPLEKQFWGDIYGVLEDKFGVFWMVNISQAK